MRIDRTLVLVACLPLIGCTADADTMTTAQSADSGGVVNTQHAPADAGGAEDTSPAFADVYAVIELHCGGGKGGCHVAGSSGGLEMHDADTAYDHLVEVASAKCPSEMRVVSGDADASQLVQALEGTSACVKPMPLGRDPLSATELALIRAWIDAGATAD